ncbi:MAG: glycoside hydrolase family 36 protein [Clostridiaceae bacterium]
MFGNLKINLTYKSNNQKENLIFNKDISNNDLKGNIILEENHRYTRLKILITPSSKIELEDISISLNYKFKANERIYANGYQSWTDSREFFLTEKMKTISPLAKPITNKYQFEKYGDYTFKNFSKKSGEFHGFTYSYIRDGGEFKLIGSLSERQGYTIIEEFTKDNSIIISKDCRSLEIEKEYMAFDLLYVSGSEKDVFDLYFDLMNIKKPTTKPMTGWTSWYNYYQNISQDIILENLNNFSELNKNIDIFQIDDGYQTAVGDWLSIDKVKFPEGMKYIKDNISKKGYKAGIWLAPFVCEKTSDIFKNHKDWILKDENNELVMAGSNWSGFYALDIYNEDVRTYIKNVFHIILNDWGYDLVKLDFLYAVCLIPRKDKTRGQIMCESMEFLRDCIQDKLILGCGVPLGPSFGIVDYCRIGCDVGLDWDDKPYMRLLHRERISTLNAMGNAIGRRHLNGRAFLNDPDVFLLRDDNITLSKDQKNTLLLINHIFGSLIFTSDNIKMYDQEKNKLFDYVMDIKNIEIETVEYYRNGLVEIIYTIDSKKFLVLANLSKSKIIYKNNLRHLKKIDFNTEDSSIYSDNNFEIQPFNSLAFEQIL